MTPTEFHSTLLVYCARWRASVTSYYRTPAHNAAVGGVPSSAHLYALGADVTYDAQPDITDAEESARRLRLKLIREKDHDHLEPLGWLSD